MEAMVVSMFKALRGTAAAACVLAAGLMTATDALAVATPPAYDLEGSWATTGDCHGTEHAYPATPITGFNATTGTFSLTLNGKPGSGTEEGASVAMEGYNREGQLEVMHGSVVRNGSSLVITASGTCLVGKQTYPFTFEFVNSSPASPSECSQSGTVARAFQLTDCHPPVEGPGGVDIPTKETLQTQLQAEQQQASQARTEMLCSMQQPIFQERLEHSPGVELKFDVVTPGTLETVVSLEGSNGVASAASIPSVPPIAGTVARATRTVKPMTIAELTRKFTTLGEYKLRVPLTSAGKTFAKKLDAAIRRYRHKHPHGHKPPSARFKVTLRYTPTA
jgi:hypothetical protein